MKNHNVSNNLCKSIQINYYSYYIYKLIKLLLYKIKI